MVYLDDRDEYLPEAEAPEGARTLAMSGGELAGA
jgi:hypothetical protein